VKNILASCCGAAILGWALALSSVAASAATDTIYSYTTPKTAYLSIAPMDFAPDGSQSATSDYFVSWSSNTLTGDGCFETGVNLPQKALIKSVRVWFQTSVFFNLLATEQSTGTTTSLVSSVFDAPEGDTSRQSQYTTLTTPHQVANGTYFYGFGVCVSPGQAFYGARITYTYDNAGD